MRRDNVMEVPLFLLVLEIAFIEVGRAVHPGCECVVFSTTFGKEKGTFKSPDFPKPYPPNIDCLLYTFVGSTDEIVQLTFQEFDVKKSQSEGVVFRRVVQLRETPRKPEPSPSKCSKDILLFNYFIP